MADYSLTSSQNWSAIKASLANGDRIIPTGAYALTLDENPALTGIDFVATGVGATIALGATATYTLQNWIIRAGTVACLTVNSSKTITGPITGYGGASANAYGIITAGTITTGIGYGGSASGASGIQVTGGTVGTGTGYAGSNGTAHGIYLNAVAAKITTATGSGGSTANSCGIYANLGQITTATGTGGSAAGSHGIYSNNAIANGTGIGGSISGAHGIVSYGGIRVVSATGNTSGAFGVDNFGVALTDVRNHSGNYAIRRSAGLMILYGGTDTSKITGTAGSLLYIPAPANVIYGIAVLDETGTGSSLKINPGLSGGLR